MLYSVEVTKGGHQTLLMDRVAVEGIIIKYLIAAGDKHVRAVAKMANYIRQIDHGKQSGRGSCRERE